MTRIDETSRIDTEQHHTADADVVVRKRSHTIQHSQSHTTTTKSKTKSNNKPIGDNGSAKLLHDIQENGNHLESLRLGRYLFKRAESSKEFAGVHKLNYLTFVQEIHQYEDTSNSNERLVDKFHEKNHYFVALKDGTISGMVSAHDEAPFSIESRLTDTSVLTDLGDRLLEVRLLAVQPGKRNSLVFVGLVWMLFEWARTQGYSHLIISAVTDKIMLYEKFGFKPLGPEVVMGDAAFMPMAMPLTDLPDSMVKNIQRWRNKVSREGEVKIEEDKPEPIVSFLPGPVQIAEDVIQAYHAPAISHRDKPFILEYERVRSILSDMVGGHDVALFTGSGTLANDALGATIQADRSLRKGLILVNGEFGDRLRKQADRLGLDFLTLSWDWGKSWDLKTIRKTLARDLNINWIWAVHLESSTGMLNNINDLKSIAQSIDGRDIHICLDCVSSLGSLPFDLHGIYLASGASGKALASYAGVGIVFAEPDALTNVDSSNIISYLDVKAAVETVGPRFTHPSPSITALRVALKQYQSESKRNARYAQYQELGQYIRSQLSSLGIEALVPDEPAASPVITTFTCPNDMECPEFLTLCQNWGYILSGLSSYLKQRRWAQIVTMGAITHTHCEPFFNKFDHWLNK